MEPATGEAIRVIRATGTTQALKALSVRVPQISGQSSRVTLVNLIPNGSKVAMGDILAEFDLTALEDPSVLDEIVQANYPDFEIVWFGHIGDGNMHLNILKPEAVSREDFLQQCKKVSGWVYGAVQKYNGSISAEHGLGNIKKPFLHYTRSETEQIYLRAIKAAFDPNGIMNPGKVI